MRGGGITPLGFLNALLHHIGPTNRHKGKLKKTLLNFLNQTFSPLQLSRDLYWEESDMCHISMAIFISVFVFYNITVIDKTLHPV